MLRVKTATDDKTQLTMKCMMCKSVQSVVVNTADLKRYETELVQDVWPDMDPDDREVIIAQNFGRAGICQDCWLGDNND